MAKKASSSKKNATTNKKSTKFSILNELHDHLTKIASVTRSGEVRIKRSDLKSVVENVFQQAAIKAAGGERVRFPVIGALVRREVKARKAGKGVNPFTGEPITIKARPASQKPRWSFPKSVKETFANKKYW
jgi:nucleoid DNA-binding protein